MPDVGFQSSAGFRQHFNGWIENMVEGFRQEGVRRFPRYPVSSSVYCCFPVSTLCAKGECSLCYRDLRLRNVLRLKRNYELYEYNYILSKSRFSRVCSLNSTRAISRGMIG